MLCLYAIFTHIKCTAKRTVKCTEYSVNLPCLQDIFLYMLFYTIYGTYIPMDIRIYILNLKRSAHRRSFMENQLAGLEYTHTFIDAIDGKDMPISTFPTYNSRLRIQKYGRDLKNTEIATTISHLKALEYAQQDMKKYGNTWAVIVEDDITMLPSFVSALQALHTYPPDVHCVRLYERIKDTTKKPDFMGTHPRFAIHRHTYKNWGGALAYAVRMPAPHAYIHHNPVVLHKADKMLFGVPYADIHVYQQTPRSVRVTDTIPSDIEYDKKHRYVGIRNTLIRVYVPWIERLRRIKYICKHWRQYRR